MADVIEAPRMDNTCLPPGAVAILSVDPVASVAALDDEQATLEAAALPRGKYLAVVDTLFGFDSSKPIYEMPLGLSFVCVGRGLPVPASASIPIAPAAAAQSDLNERPPLALTPALPWSDCYVYTLECFYGQIARVFPCSPPTGREPTVATEEQWDIINSAVSMDQVSADLPMRDVYGEPMDLPDDGLDTDNEPSNYDVESYVMQRQSAVGEDKRDAVGEVQPGSGPVKANGEAPVEEQTGIPPDQDPQRTWPRLEVWLDLTSTPEFDQPAALMGILRKLTVIIHESKQRKRMNFLDKRPRTMQWADDVAAADGAVDLERPDESLPTQAVDDTLLVPEDAIEHRREQAQSQLAQTQPSSTPGPHDDLAQKRSKDRLKIFLAGSFNSLRGLVRRLQLALTCTADPK